MFAKDEKIKNKEQYDQRYMGMSFISLSDLLSIKCRDFYRQ